MIGILAGKAEEAMVVLKGIIWGVMVLILWGENVSSLRGGNLGEAMEAGEAVTVSSGVGAVVVEMEGGVSLPPEGVRCLVVGLVGSLNRILQGVTIKLPEIRVGKSCVVRLDDNKGKGKQVMGDKSGGDAKGKKLDDSNQGDKGKKDSSDSTYGWQTKMVRDCHLELGDPADVPNCLINEPNEKMGEHTEKADCGDTDMLEADREGLCEFEGETGDIEGDAIRADNAEGMQMGEKGAEEIYAQNKEGVA
ncbi:hypothetical protein GUJ93_ZPchr0001g29293 [Zizania palustris]|uniref:Uncharacterized protein n=1 Tax=Zizania palustris TaxID=103762 RepID=A0A8J5VQ36_ZIZPA|nr:hypothetical protein GUJ93_ZPchr0001g29293 [Zizania palustris]